MDVQANDASEAVYRIKAQSVQNQLQHSPIALQLHSALQKSAAGAAGAALPSVQTAVSPALPTVGVSLGVSGGGGVGGVEPAAAANLFACTDGAPASVARTPTAEGKHGPPRDQVMATPNTGVGDHFRSNITPSTAALASVVSRQRGRGRVYVEERSEKGRQDEARRMLRLRII
jgi:hypothetical protein